MSAIAATVALAPGARASDTLPWEGDRAADPHQPYQRAYNPDQVLRWTAGADPDSELLRSRVPLQQRAGALAAAQRTPGLPVSTQSLVLAGDYGNAFFESHAYTGVFSQHLFEYWQYVDVYASWHGMAALGTPKDRYHPEKEWTQRWFEFGAVNLPNPAYTDAAHRNGAISLGTIFFSDNDRGSQSFEELLVRDGDGGLPAVGRLAAMAVHFGFDGWFVNQEQVSVTMTREQIRDYREFLAALRAEGMYVQWYDSVTDDGVIDYQNEFTPANSPWVINAEQGRVADSIFLNYWWDRAKLTASAEHARAVGLDPLTSVYAGVEAGMYQFEQPYDLRDNLDRDGAPMNAIAALGADFTHSDFEGKTDDARQHEAFDRARRWWIGTADGQSTPEEDAWQGMAAYIAERSPITGTVFSTRFCTGHGMGTWRDGEKVGDAQWGNIGVQDVPVTWQWWFEGAGTLQADLDHGPSIPAAERFSYEPRGGYDGGSSLVIEGDLDGSASLRLFRSELEITAATQIHVVAWRTSGLSLSAAIAFSDDPGSLQEFPLEFDGPEGGWSIGTADLGVRAGSTAVVLGLGLSSEGSERMQVNIGAYTVSPSDTAAPRRPRHLGVRYAIPATGELVVDWTADGFDRVSRYELSLDGAPLGAIYGDVLYAKDISELRGTLSLEAVGHDGQRSRPATVSLDATAVGAVQAVADGAALTVSWERAAKAGTVVNVRALDAGDDAFSAESAVGKGATSTVLTGVPVDGSRVLVTVDSRGSTPASTITALADQQLEPYPVAFATIEGTSLTLRRPDPDYWSTLTVLEDGQALAFDTTYSQGEKDHWIRGRALRTSLVKTLSSTDSRVVVRLSDYAGNTVETVLREGR